MIYFTQENKGRFLKTMEVKKDKCVACQTCVSCCPVEAISIVDGKAKIDKEKCINCGTCKAVCPVGAIENK